MQAIIDFRWNIVYKAMMHKLFLPYLLYLSLYTAYALMPDLQTEPMDSAGRTIQLTLLFGIVILSGYHLYIEVIQSY